MTWCEKTTFSSTVDIETIILPRQARDKHRKSGEKRGFVVQAAAYEANALPLDGINLDTEWHRNQKGYLDGNRENWYSGVFDWDRTLYNSPMEMMDWLETRCGGKRLLLRHFMLKLIILPRRRLRTTYELQLRRKSRFSAGGSGRPGWTCTNPAVSRLSTHSSQTSQRPWVCRQNTATTMRPTSSRRMWAIKLSWRPSSSCWTGRRGGGTTGGLTMATGPRSRTSTVRKTPFCEPVKCIEHDQFTKTGSGQT
jgi:hypothetical protein